MDLRRLGAGALVGGLVMLALGYLLWDILFAGFFAEWSEGDITNWWWVAVGSIIMGFVLTLWLLRGGTTGWVDGARDGAAIGFMIWLGVDLLYYGWDGGILPLHLMDAVLEGIRWGGTGAIVALVIGVDTAGEEKPVEARDQTSSSRK